MNLTKKVLTKLKVGDCLEFGKLFPGLDDEPLVWEAIHTEDIARDGRRQWLFDVHWHGVMIGRAQAVLDKGLVRLTTIESTDWERVSEEVL